MKSFEKFDYCELVAIDQDNTIIAGHQRIHIMLELGWGEKEIEVRMPSRKLSSKEQDQYLIMSNKVTGDWDYDLLANHFEVEELCEWGFDKKDFDIDDFINDEELDEKEVDETLTDGLEIICKFVISIVEEDATSLHNQLDELLKAFPSAKLEKKI